MQYHQPSKKGSTRPHEYHRVLLCKCSAPSSPMVIPSPWERPLPPSSGGPAMVSRVAASSTGSGGCITGCATASCCELASKGWFPQLLFLCENFTKISHDFCLIGELIFCGKYGIIYIERKLRREFSYEYHQPSLLCGCPHEGNWGVS